MCNWFATPGQAAAPDGNHCVNLNVYTVTTNTEIDGSYYYWDANANANTPDWNGLPIYGLGPYPG